MLTGNLLIIIGLTGILAILALVQFVLASRHDHEIAAAPRYRTLEVLDEEIQRKENTKVDLEEELDKRRAAMAIVADIGADVDALEKKRDELTTEWEQLEERRNEVHQLRIEIKLSPTLNTFPLLPILPIKVEPVAPRPQGSPAQSGPTPAPLASVGPQIAPMLQVPIALS